MSHRGVKFRIPRGFGVIFRGEKFSREIRASMIYLLTVILIIVKNVGVLNNDVMIRNSRCNYSKNFGFKPAKLFLGPL